MTRVVAALIVAGTWLLAAQTRGPLLHPSRQAATDLQVGDSQFVSYQDLLRLPQVQFITSDDSNFATPARVSGVRLDELKRALGPDADMVVAICADGYRSNYPAAYLAAHHPVLVLTVNGEAQGGWPKTREGNMALGPYVIANPSFTPSFKVLSHTDEAQIPFQVVRLDFRNEREVFGAIAPQGSYAPDSPVMQGYRIAQQNCYRCHNMGAEGGHMASVPWPVVGALAKGNAEFFAKYVRNPQAVNPSSRMAASPEYDDATIAALRAYFSTFAAGGP
jgi:mono/diheme cytochrome c family protein